nr:MAG TPA: hypothetical protein [Caudoviricetes sp.]
MSPFVTVFLAVTEPRPYPRRHESLGTNEADVSPFVTVCHRFFGSDGTTAISSAS